MSELVPLSGEIVEAPPAAEMRYEPEDPDAVTRVFVRVEYADGRIREYQAKEPDDFDLRESMTIRPGGGPHLVGATVTTSTAVPTLRLSFTAHPRFNMHIRTEATAPEDFEGITYG